MQDELSRGRLSEFSKIAKVEFDDKEVIDQIMKDYFTKMDISGPKETEDISITTSPIVRELYFRDRFKEIEDPEKLAMELEQETKKQPITKNCMQSVRNIAVTRKASEVRKASHEVKEEYTKRENLIQDNEEEKE
jgi:hypothetical protein